MTEDSEGAILVSVKEIKQITCIQYPIVFSGSVTQDSLALDLVSVLFDSGNEVIAMHLVFAKRLSLVMQATNVGSQKIDGNTLETYEMVVAAFSVTDQANKVRFFEEIFLIVNVGPDMVLEIPFLILSSADVNFPKREL